MANNRFTKSYDLGFMAPPVQTAAATATTGGSIVPGTYYLVATYTTATGETIAGNEVTIVVPSGTSTNTITANFGTAPASATGGKVYVGTAAGLENSYFTFNTGVTSLVLTSVSGTAATPPAVSTAAITVLPYTIVKYTSTDFTVLPGTAATDFVCGVLTEVGATSGERVDVVHLGTAYVLAGGTINAGDVLVSNASGQAVAASSITTSTDANRGIGFARQSAVAGDVFEAIIQLQAL